MEVFKKLLLVFSITFAMVTSGFADIDVSGDEYWPFPLGSECPFAWNFVSSTDWQIDLNGEMANISFYISEESTSHMRIMTVVYSDDWDLIAYGNQVYKEKSFILFLKLIDFRDDSEFVLNLRLYDNDSKVLPRKATFSAPRPYKRNWCKNMSNTSLAATVMNRCIHPACGAQNKHQVLNKKED